MNSFAGVSVPRVLQSPLAERCLAAAVFSSTTSTWLDSFKFLPDVSLSIFALFANKKTLGFAVTLACRTYALYGRRRRVLYPLAILGFGVIGFGLVSSYLRKSVVILSQLAR